MNPRTEKIMGLLPRQSLTSQKKDSRNIPDPEELDTKCEELTENINNRGSKDTPDFDSHGSLQNPVYDQFEDKEEEDTFLENRANAKEESVLIEKCDKRRLVNIAESEILDIDRNEENAKNDDNHYQEAKDTMDFDSDDSLVDPTYEEDEEDIVAENNNDAKEESIQKGRIRRRLESSWKVNVQKKKVTAGKEHSSKKKIIPAKTVGPACKKTCHFKCSEKITVETREAINTMFWHPNKDINHKRQFVASHVKSVPIARKRSKTGAREDAREHTRQYYFEIHDCEIRVCKIFFLNTLNISQTFVTTALKKKEPGGLVTPDERGKHQHHAKVPEFVRQNVRDHIMKFPSEESHYSRERSKRKFLGSHLNLSKMYSLYRSECEENNLADNLIAKEWLYCDIFNTEFNLSFKPPDNDTCDQCDYFRISLRDAQNVNDKDQINREYEEHLAEASTRYDLKKKDKEDAAQNKINKIMLCVDLQKCLPTPVLTNSQSFYSLKLWTHNYTLYDATNKMVTCVMWDESKSSRGANEMASGMLKWALTNIKPQHDEITIWSDNCPSQNRNIIMVMAYFWILKIFPSLKTINHKFLLRGHTHLEVDASHSLIERERKYIAGFQIMTPWDWQQLARMCSKNNPFQIINMETEDFKDFKQLYNNSTSPFINRKKTDTGEDVSISKMVHLQVRAAEKGFLYFKTDFKSQEFTKVDLNRTGRRIILPEEIPPIRNGLNPISTKKYKHLQNLLKWVPREFHDYYKNLLHDNQARDE